MAVNSDVHYVRYYTAGSAARELAPKTPQRAKPAQKARKPRKAIVYIDPVAIISVVTAIVMMVVMILGVVQLSQLKAEASAMQSYVLDLKAENAQMTTQYQEGYNLEEVEKTAIALGMVPADQVTHVQLGN